MSNEADATDDGPTLDDICKPVPQARSWEEEAEFQRALMADIKRLYLMNNAGELIEYGGQYVAMVDGKIVGNGKNQDDLERRVSQELRVPVDRVAIWRVSTEMPRLRITPVSDAVPDLSPEPEPADAANGIERDPDAEAAFQHEVMADAERLLLMNNAGELAAFVGQHVAMVDGRILGGDRNLQRLRCRVNQGNAIPYDRIVTMFISTLP